MFQILIFFNIPVLSSAIIITTAAIVPPAVLIKKGKIYAKSAAFSRFSIYFATGYAARPPSIAVPNTSPF